VEFKRKSTAEFKNKQEWLEYQGKLRGKLKQMLGKFPLGIQDSAEVIEREEKSTYVQEKIILSSPGEEPIPLYILRPVHIETKIPAVLFLHGHSSEGKTSVLQEYGARKLAEKGYLVLAADSKGYGERDGEGKRIIAGDSYVGKEWYERLVAMNLLIQGKTYMGQFLFDIRRALDYLATREEVDKERIGCTGHSMGGMETIFVTALEKRIKVGVESCGIASLESLIRNNVVHNFSLYVPNILLYADFPEIVALIAPKPFMMLAGKQDIQFPFGGVEEVFQGAEYIYRLLGRENHLAGEFFAGGHEFGEELQEKAFRWFDKWL